MNSDGVMGVPVDITHIGNTFFMVTKNGKIESSIDNGKTWTELFATSKGESFSRIRFADAEKGIALSEGLAYITYDGGKLGRKRISCHQSVPLLEAVKYYGMMLHGVIPSSLL